MKMHQTKFMGQHTRRTRWLAFNKVVLYIDAVLSFRSQTHIYKKDEWMKVMNNAIVT